MRKSKEERRAGPERTCIGCGKKRPKRSFYRLALDAQGHPVIDSAQGAPGRGAYLCGRGCLVAAAKRKALQRAFRGKATSLDWTSLEATLQLAP